MIELTKYSDENRGGGSLFLNPDDVTSVEETEHRRAYGGWNLTATITMRNGQTFVVYDGSRTVAVKVRKHREERNGRSPSGEGAGGQEADAG